MEMLDRLADLAGIEPSYYSIWGDRVSVPDPTKIAILEALGHPAGTEAQQEASLQALEHRPWRAMIDPVSVIKAEDQPGSIIVRTVAGQAGRPLPWTIIEESGAVHEGEVELDSLPVVESRDVDGRLMEARDVPLPLALPEGYHELRFGRLSPGADPLAAGQAATLIVAPPRCWTTDDIGTNASFWGISCQLYSLRSERNWGIGNYGDLLTLVDYARRDGAHLVGLNPLHALYPAQPEDASPYSPASRDYLNVLAIDVEAVPDFAESPDAQRMIGEPLFRKRLEKARSTELVDYATVAEIVFPVLRVLHDSFQKKHAAKRTERARAFETFCAERQPSLVRFATFLALQGHLAKDDPACLDWRKWPEEFHRPDSPAVAAFARENEAEIGFHTYLQWISDEQVKAAAAKAEDSGMSIGLYRDLAIGVSPASAMAWSEPDSLVRGVSVGAPPDPFNQLGQNWGLSPLDPLMLRQLAFGPYIAAIRANMRHSGALRIDHVMGLMHLYWVVEGDSAAAGSYVKYPFEEMVRILALESRRQRCIVIGEDLGTVPEGFRPAMSSAGILSYKVLLFERLDGGLFKQPDEYPRDALVTAGTHDLSPLAGYWVGRDLEWRQEINLYPSAEARDQDVENRRVDRRRLLDALIYGQEWAKEPWLDTDTLPFEEAMAEAIYRFLARTPCSVMLVAIEDLLGQVEQMNLPGTVLEHPNWRRKLSKPVDKVFAEPLARRILAAVREIRGS
ncbi:MAG: 4-alpha-glucanotransferase [Alphaproteobacteria bacterium]|jgi:4-alpha-glucanotransferase|nr:4-alpha-glucanotransferase [Alphaproteobacteria bacterium]